MHTQPRPPSSEDAPRPFDSVQPGLLGTFDERVDVPAQLATHAAEVHEMRGEVERLRADRDRLQKQQAQIAELLNSPNPDKIVHDLRNLLNEVQLYKLLIETQEK